MKIDDNIDLFKVYAFVKGQKVDSNQLGTTSKRGISTVAAMKMIFALVSNQRLVSAPYRDIAKEANIYPGAVGTIIADLTGTVNPVVTTD